MRRAIVVTAVLLGSFGPAGAHPLTHEACSDVRGEVSTFIDGGTHLTSWYENLDFDGAGGLWAINLTGKLLERFDAAGKRTASMVMPRYPLGARRGPDGSIYVGSVDFIDHPASAADGAVYRVDPHAVAPALELVSDDVRGVNGMAFDAADNLYLAYTYGSGIGRLGADGVYDADWAPVSGSNGLNIHGGALYATETFEHHSRVWRIPLDDPAAADVLVELSSDKAWKWVDDGALGPDGRLYLGAHATGELLRVDLETGAVCVVVSGLANPTSARFAHGFGSFDPARDLFVSLGGGQIAVVHVGDAM